MNGETKKSVGSVLYDDVMGGLRPMIPFVAGGGILMAISFMFGMRIGDDSVNQFAKILYEIGHNNAMLLMIPIFAGFIAHTIAGQDALAPGMIGGMIAKTTGSGFLGGIVAGFLAGYIAYDDYEKALKMGVAAGSASAFSSNLATKEETYKLFNRKGGN